MAHFAEIDENNVVTRVIVVDDVDTADELGVETESIGQTFCTALFGGNWLLTRDDGTLRYNYAGIGYIWDSEANAFYNPKPFPSWVLNSTYQWEAPVPYPEDDKMYSWDEETTAWVLIRTE